jgi:hypothetical protein
VFPFLESTFLGSNYQNLKKKAFPGPQGRLIQKLVLPKAEELYSTDYPGLEILIKCWFYPTSVLVWQIRFSQNRVHRVPMSKPSTCYSNSVNVPIYRIPKNTLKPVRTQNFDHSLFKISFNSHGLQVGRLPEPFGNSTESEKSTVRTIS